MRQALLMLEQPPPGRRQIILMIAEKRDRSSNAKLPEVVEQVQRLNAAIYLADLFAIPVAVHGTAQDC